MTPLIATAVAGLVCIPILTWIISAWESIFPPRDHVPSCKLCAPNKHKDYEGAPCSACTERDRQLPR